ncbi:DASS family sodium-coupled anion symporter [bacterium]|nr:DASS family sodium-coupled anion symporter [bacterium]
MKLRRIFSLSLGVVLAVLVYIIPIGNIPPLAKRCLSIFVIAAVFWVTEAVPLYVTSFIVLLLEAILLRSPKFSYKIFVSPFFSPVIILFLGGYILSSGLHKYRIDRILARKILGIFGTRPALITLGIMLVTGFLSMWMSNTATTAMMIAVALPIIYSLEKDDKFRKLIILAIPFAANLGGMATPIGTPPNAIAFAAIKELDKTSSMTFLNWMKFAFPISILLLIMAWVVLLIFFKPKEKNYKFNIEVRVKIRWQTKVVSITTVITILLWLTSFFHHVPSGIVALLPPIIFLSSGILDVNDFRSIGWDVLMLLGGGLSLGVAMSKTGLSSWVISQINFQSLPTFFSMGMISTITVAMSSFMSNTATTNLLMPIVTKIPTIIPIDAAISTALAASVAMILPISTPPNAIAYGSNEIKVKDMIKAGAVITVVSLIILVLLGIIINKAR